VIKGRMDLVPTQNPLVEGSSSGEFRVGDGFRPYSSAGSVV